MGVQKTILHPGNGRDRPVAGDSITMSYVGHFYDPTKYLRGAEFDSSRDRGDFTTTIGNGEVIRGWEIGVLEEGGGMTLGERATLVISSDYAYGEEGFPGIIPPNSCLLFEVELKAINGKAA